MAVSIVFNMINVNSINTDAAISVGENNLGSWDTHSKNNYGNGAFYGNTLSPTNLNFVSDLDAIDSPVYDQDFKPNATIQQV
ncbi:MAG: hypothetical protein GX892_09570 [Thermoanaerobacteraceae bacterium]|nr:hypothetical protein [Thermoanaerobacteraceae bacterium]